VKRCVPSLEGTWLDKRTRIKVQAAQPAISDSPVEQLIGRVNMLMQHYHTSTNLSKKLDASLRYLQLQLGTPNNPFLLDYAVWGYLAPLSWVKILWRTLHHFDIHLI
jgi:hypothetical protein